MERRRYLLSIHSAKGYSLPMVVAIMILMVAISWRGDNIASVGGSSAERKADLVSLSSLIAADSGRSLSMGAFSNYSIREGQLHITFTETYPAMNIKNVIISGHSACIRDAYRHASLLVMTGKRLKKLRNLVKNCTQRMKRVQLKRAESGEKRQNHRG